MSSRESANKTASKRQLELIVKLKTKVGLPVGNIWNYNEHEAYQIIRLLRNYANNC